MKKLIIFISVFIATIYLSSAIDIVLNSWQKLDNSSWDNLSWILNKVDISWNNLNINWKFSVDWKICDVDDNCLWECTDWKIWDNVNNTCILPASTPETAKPNSTCKTILADNPWVLNKDWYYYIWPTWFADKFKAYCDMTTNWWGRTRWFKSTNNIGDTSDFTSCRTNKIHYDSNVECIFPYGVTASNYWVKKWTANKNFTSLPSNQTEYNSNPNWVLFWTRYDWYSCREYNRDWWNKWRWWWSHSLFQNQIECYLR